MDLLLDPSVWASFVTLTLMEIVLGIDNVIFVSIVANRLPEDQRAMGRTVGLAGALVMRIGLLFAIAWLFGLTASAFSVMGHDVSWRDMILIAGGVFLLTKATLEIHKSVEGEEDELAPSSKVASATFGIVIAQIMALDMKMLALSFLMLIGVALIADGLQFHIPRGYLYAAIGFSVAVEALNQLARRNRRKA